MTSIIPIEGRAVGGDGGGLQILAPGISLPFADARYIKRLVGGVLAGNTYETQFAGIPALGNPSGPVVGRLPEGGWTLNQESDDGGWFSGRIKAYRSSDAPRFRCVRFNGAIEAPSQVLSGEDCGGFEASGCDEAGAARIVGRVSFFPRENVSSTGRGGEVVFTTVVVGETQLRAVLRVQLDSASIGVLRSSPSTLRIVPATTGQIRVPNNTATLVEWNATGLGFYGTAPIAKPTVTGSRGGNAALASALTQLAALGILTDSSTA